MCSVYFVSPVRRDIEGLTSLHVYPRVCLIPRKKNVKIVTKLSFPVEDTSKNDINFEIGKLGLLRAGKNVLKRGGK